MRISDIRNWRSHDHRRVPLRFGAKHHLGEDLHLPLVLVPHPGRDHLRQHHPGAQHGREKLQNQNVLLDKAGMDKKGDYKTTVFYVWYGLLMRLGRG